ncbi:hypothetical protein [Salibacterium halotolerans]|uniref:Magnesium chelatase family protein n=1 Tax=Salibacterium halotolerans TaxID=1884432 RepID=A0A1I5VV06_9BACI|nr:hypothetical protein [Salibacterium halotolerans]SFQ11404.1 magnesium chelatase family protein [Salibacterium halotolerans]
MTVQLEPVNLQTAEQPESSSIIRKRVRQARAQQHERHGGSLLNGNAAFETLLSTLEHPQHQQQMLQTISQQNHWSNRTQVKILRIARTIADLQASSLLRTEHLNEAITYHTNKDDLRITRISEPPAT